MNLKAGCPFGMKDSDDGLVGRNSCHPCVTMLRCRQNRRLLQINAQAWSNERLISRNGD